MSGCPLIMPHLLKYFRSSSSKQVRQVTSLFFMKIKEDFKERFIIKTFSVAMTLKNNTESGETKYKL